MASDSSDNGEHGATTRAHRFELSLRYEEEVAPDPSEWRFTLSDPLTNEQVGGVGVAGLPEAVALLTSRIQNSNPAERPSILSE